MSKPLKNSSADTENEAFEMIELALNDLDALTRAFDLISEICEEREPASILSLETPPKNLVN